MGKTEKLIALEQELKIYVKAMKEAAQIIIDEDVSNYPIFVAHQQEVEIGIQLIKAGDGSGVWNIHASTLEEFVSKNIIFEEKLNEFKSSYKSPGSHVCVFVLSELGATFNYLKI
jgi:tRNA A58 N-methylase Trm61